MKHFLPFSMLLAGAAFSGSAFAQETRPDLTPSQEHPNIILFLVDDMGWQETSVPFYKEETPLNRRYKTPNMEKMAKNGVKFMQAYACAISSPTRCSLMSGMNAARHRVTNWTLNYNTQTDASSNVIQLPSWNFNGIQPAAKATAHDLANGTPITSFPEILQQAGYYTIHCGKAHFGSETTTGADPSNFGFDVNIAGAANGGPGSYLAENEYGSGSFHVSGLEEYYNTGTFLTEALTLEALKAIEKPINENRPFYLYMSHYAIHTPYDADTRYTGNYTNYFDEQLQANLNNQEINHAALVEGMDKSLGDIMKYLEGHPDVAKNTVVLFMADNGGQAVSVRQGRANYDQNWPARGGKGSAYEGGVHEPMMLYWPGNDNVKPGTENQSRIMIEDFFPTILDLAGVEDYETVQKVDGKSFADILRDPSIERTRTNIWHFPNLWGESQDKAEGYGAYSAILKGDYRMIYFWESQERRLYNIKEDIGETNNLAKTEPELLKELSKELTDSLKAYDAQRPSYKETGEVIPWPDEAPAPVEIGEAVPITAGIFKYSTEDVKYYYRISDNRGSQSNNSNFYWTLGEHNGYKAIQATQEQFANAYDATKQYFYFMPGSDDTHFTMYTVDGRKVNYVDGKTGSGWNGGNIGSDVTTPYMQYDTEASGEFQLISIGTIGRYAIKAPNGDILNDRGTGNGSAANMKWVINTYSGITLNDAGSNYKFTAVPGNSISGLITELYNKYKENADYVGAHDISTLTPIYEEAMKDPDLEDLKTMEEAYAKTPTVEMETGKIYRLRNYMRKISTGNTACNGAGGYLEPMDANNPDHNLCNKGGYSAVDADNAHANALWRAVPAATEGTFYLLNLNTGKYISKTGVANNAYAQATDNEAEALALKLVEYGDMQFKVAVASDESLRLHISGLANSGSSARLMFYNGEEKGTASAWYMIHARDIDVTTKESADGNFASAYLPVAVDMPEGLKAYTGKVNGEKLDLKEIEGTVPAETGIVLKGDKAQVYTLPIIDEEVTALEDNDLKGSLIYKAVEDMPYFQLMVTDEKADFQSVTSDYLTGNAAWVDGTGITAPNGLELSFGVHVGIDQIEADKKDSKIYDLTGRRVKRPAKGIYIQNGQKVIY